MKEKHVNLCNKLLYYFVAPALLVYFTMIDIGFLTSSFAVLGVFGTLIVLGVAIQMIYKKKNGEYKFEVNRVYANAMAVLVIWELGYNMYK